MATARVTCTTCGDVRITVRAITTSIASDNGIGMYRFDCPSCGHGHEVEVRLNVLRKLNSLGARRCEADTDSVLDDSYITLEETIQFNATLADDGKVGSALEQLAKDD